MTIPATFKYSKFATLALVFINFFIFRVLYSKLISFEAKDYTESQKNIQNEFVRANQVYCEHPNTMPLVNRNKLGREVVNHSDQQQIREYLRKENGEG